MTPIVDSAMYEWFKQAQLQGEIISYSVFQAKAMEFNQKMELLEICGTLDKISS